VTEEKGGFPYFKQVGIGALGGLLTLTLIILGLSIAAPSTPKATNTPAPSSSSTPSATPTSTIARDCKAGDAATDPLLASMQAVVINATTDEVLFDRGANTPAATASTMKVLTAGAALLSLGPNYRVDTKVYADPADSSSIIIVGAGDPTLSRLKPGQQSVYKDAPKLSDLAVQVNAWASANGVTKLNMITLDSTLFADPKWEASWERTEQTQGYMSEVSALQVDGDRANPQAETSPRSTTPVANAGKYFKSALGAIAKTATVSEGKLPMNSTKIATVSSQPISVWIKHMLQVSDNTEAEFLARLVAIKGGLSASFSSIDLAIKKALLPTKIDTTGVVIKDGSGLSDNNRVAPVVLAKFMKLVLDGYADFDVIKQGLPVAHESGSLSARFGGANIDAAGHIFAKTGWIKKGYTLAGIIKAQDGTDLLFAIYALGDVKPEAKDAIDTLATAFYRCGNKLSNE
jgi:D-alanyl-D-alanine carboxypeptidase/D-alanyl-D-alanine-endopeptidase (penicillin-binding protein 4)